MNKKLGTRNIIIISTAIILPTVGIPILINESYKCGRGYTTIWGAEDVLSYYGNIIGSAVTIIALIITIWFTNKNNRESFEQQKKIIIAEYKVEQIKLASGDKLTDKKADEKAIEKDKYNKLKSELFKNRSDIQKEYIDNYEGYILYKGDQLELKIKGLYI